MVRIKLLVVALFLGVLTFAGPVFAESETTSTDHTDTTMQDSTSAEDKRASRIAEYKQIMADKLTEAQTKRLTNKCKSAQGLVTSYHAKLNNVIANRKKVYMEIGDKLDSLITKLQNAGIDTTKLETARDDIKSEAQALSDSLDSYDIVLSDLESMDCESDPEGFKAALEDARDLQNKLREQATEFRRFATTELREIIKELRSELELKQQSTQADDTNTTNTEGGEQ